MKYGGMRVPSSTELSVAKKNRALAQHTVCVFTTIRKSIECYKSVRQPALWTYNNNSETRGWLGSPCIWVLLIWGSG